MVVPGDWISVLTSALEVVIDYNKFKLHHNKITPKLAK